MNDAKTIEERLDILERKQAITEKMIEHMNSLIKDNIIAKIEADVARVFGNSENTDVVNNETK